MKASNRKVLEQKFWKVTTSEEEESFLRENAESGSDALLKAYLSATSGLAGEDFEVISKGERGKVKNIKVVYGLSLAAAVAAIWFLLLPVLPIGPQDQPRQASELTTEQIAVTKKVMERFDKSWQSGFEVANKPFKKIDNIEIKSFTNRNN